jgi:tetratricopeptide (TPR) repeat protein
MRRLFGLGSATLSVGAAVALLVSGCAMDAPEGDGDLGSVQHGLNAPEQEHVASLDPALLETPIEAQATRTAAAQELEANAETCDAACMVRHWFSEERYAEAREVLADRLTDAPTDEESALLLASVEIADEEYTSAYGVTDDSLRHAPQSIRLLEKRAMASLLGQDVETAIVDFEALIDQLQTFEGENRQSICDALNGRCTAPLAREALAWMGLATALYNRGDLDRAQSIAFEMLESEAFRDSFNPAYAWFVLGLTHSRRGDDASALTFYEKVLSRHPNEPASLINIGGIHYRAGDLDKSLDYTMAALDHAGRSRRSAAIAWSNAGEIDLLRGDYKAAEDKLFESIAVSKRFAAGHFNLAVLRDLQGRHAEAARHMATGRRFDQYGVTLWNTSFFSADWEAHFQALTAESKGQARAATTLWEQLEGSSVDVIAASARRHLGLDEVADTTELLYE